MDFKSVKIYNKLLKFQFPYEKSHTAMGICLPTFYSESTRQSFFKIESSESLEYVTNVKYEVSNLSDRDIRSSGLAMSFGLKRLNNLQVNRRLRDEGFEYFQKHESKKIKKGGLKLKKDSDKKTDSGSDARASGSDRLQVTRVHGQSQAAGADKPASLNPKERESSPENRPFPQQQTASIDPKPIVKETITQTPKTPTRNVFKEDTAAGDLLQVPFLRSFPQSFTVASFSPKHAFVPTNKEF